MHLVKTDHITIAKDRQRHELNEQAILDLANSIADIGLISPVVVRFDSNKDLVLVAGERRMRAIEVLSGLGQSFTHGGKPVPEGTVPCILHADLDPIDAFEIELEENIRREDLSWQDRSVATSRLYELRRLKAERAGTTLSDAPAVAASIYPDKAPGTAVNKVHDELILARHLKDPDVAKAPSAKEGLKVIARKEEAARQIALGESVGKTFGRHSHDLIQGDCLLQLANLPPATFDVILTDPPYGVDAQDFNDSGGKANAAGHTYDDSFPTWRALLGEFSHQSYCLAKPQAHCYVFCDVDNFIILRDLMRDAGWKTFRTPFIWHNPTSQRAPWPTSGPHRRYQMCLYAIKGDRPVLKLAPDVVTYASDTNLGWAAQKPVALYQDFLSRSCRAGDSVLDPFAGSGTIFPAAHNLRVRATGIEIDPAAYGIAVKRLAELK
jgi:site-specific DNA-methyltransferase (adenine-specific)